MRGNPAPAAGFLAGPHALQLFIDDGADLRHVAQAQTFGERQRRLVQHLAGSDIGARVLIIEALLTRQIVGRGSDRQVAGFLVPLGGVFRFGQEVEELRHAGVGLFVPCPASPTGWPRR